MRKGLVLLHGLPGVGKSTLARGLAERLPEFYYADLAKHPDFRKRPMGDLCAELYELEGRAQSLITEGVLPRARVRDDLVRKLIRRSAERAIAFEFAVIINLVADLALLASRRNRSLTDYEKRAAKVSVGSDRFTYRTLHLGSNSKPPTDDIERLVAIVKECETLGI